MIGWTFAIGLLLCPTIALVFISRSKGERTHLAWWLLMGFAVAGIVGFAALAFTVHACLEGQPPWSMYVLPLGSLVAVLGFVRPRGLALGLAAVLGSAFVAGIHSWLGLVHRGDWSGNPDLSWHLHDLPLMEWRRAMDRGAASRDRTEYAPGWLDESLVLRAHPEEAKILAGSGKAYYSLPHAEVHTVLSGLYAMRPTRIGYWYPGGPLSTGLPGIEVRPRE